MNTRAPRRGARRREARPAITRPRRCRSSSPSSARRPIHAPPLYRLCQEGGQLQLRTDQGGAWVTEMPAQSNHQTTNLGVRSSNLFGRASKIGTYRTDMSLGECSRDSQETLQTPLLFQIGHRPSKRTCHGRAMSLMGKSTRCCGQASRARSQPARCSSCRYRSRVCPRAPRARSSLADPVETPTLAVATRRHQCAHANGSRRSRHRAPWRGVAAWRNGFAQ